MAQSAQQGAIPAAVLESLRELLGAEHVLSDQVDREMFSHDFSDITLATAGVVVQPGSTHEVARVAQIASAANLALVPRGGGMSYTLGYSPLHPASVLIDTRRMNRIIEINREDLYITVECCVTWPQLFKAIRNRELRMPFLC